MKKDKMTNTLSRSLLLKLGEERLRNEVSTGDTCSTRDTPKSCRILSVDALPKALPSNKTNRQKIVSNQASIPHLP